MAKKVVVPEDGVTEDNKPKVKKRSKCCTCCLVFLIVVLVILAAAFGVGWYLGDKFTKEYLDMSLGDTLGVVSDLYWANDKKVVSNPYTADDLDGFYKEIKRNIMLKEDTDIDFDGALEKALDEFLSESGGGSDNANVSRSLNDGGSADDGTTESESSIMDVFTDMIVEVLNRDNIDIERLNEYDENDPATDTYVFNLNDRQLAAFISSVLKAALSKADKIDGLKDVVDMVKLADVVALKQIKFTADKGADGVVKASLANITVWIGLQNAAGQAFTKLLGDNGIGWAAPLARGLGNMLLPANLYINVGIPLFGDAEPVVSFNNMDDSERVRAYKLVNGVLALSGGEDQTVEGMLGGFADQIKPYLETAAQNMNFDKASEGTIKMDLLDVVTKMASENFEGDPLTKGDFLYLLQALFSDPEVQLENLEPYRYTNRYLVDGKEVYIKGGDPTKTPINYEREFIKEIENKYAVKFGESATLKDVLAMLGVSLDGNDGEAAGSTDLLNLIDGEGFNALLDRDIKDIKLNVTDRMLAAALSGQMNELITGGESDFSGMRISLDALTFTKKAEKPDNLYALLAVEADLTDMLGSFGDDDIVTRLATGLMPEKLILTVTVDITRNRAVGVAPDPVEFLLNSCENTDRALSVLEKLAPSLDLGAMSEQIEGMLNDMLDQMYKMLDVKLIPSAAVKTDGVWTGNTGAIELPDIFTVVTDTVLVDENDERVVSPDELKTVLRELNDTSGVTLEPGIADGYSGFIDQVVDKYYLKPADGDKLETFADLTAFMSDFDTSKFRIFGDDARVKYLAYDTRSAAELCPTMTGAEIGALLSEQMGEGVKDYAVRCVTTDTDSLSLVLSIGVGDLLPEEVKFLLTEDELFVTATIDLSHVSGAGTDGDPYRYDVSATLNGMSGKVYDDTLKIIRFFNSDFDVATQIEEFGEIMYEQLQSVNDGFAASVGDGNVDSNTDFFRFTEAGLVMNDFYTFLASKMNLTLDEGTTSETLKSAVQGMYERSTVEGLQNPNNYLRTDVLVNIGNAAGSEASPGMNKTYSDVEFNAYLAKGVEAMGSVKVEQTIVLSKADTDPDGKATAVRRWASSRLAPELALSASKDYLLVTVGMEMGDYMESDNDKSQGFLLSAVTGTIIYEYSDGVFAKVGIIFNDLGYNEYGVLQQLMGLSADTDDKSKVNIATVDGETVKILNDLTKVMNIEFGRRYNDAGIGSIITSSKQA